MRGTRIGVQSPSTPPSNAAGCRALFGQTFMQSPQRMQRSRKCGSSSEPGGRMRYVPAGVLTPGPDRTSGTITAPAAAAVMRARRLTSGVSRVCLAGEGDVDHVKLSPPVGQSCMQFRQRWHSALRHCAPGMGSSPPWQCCRQRRQLSHFESSLRICTSDQREQTPSSAPSGQIARHQKRVTRLLRTSTKTKSEPTRNAWWKCGCLKLSTVAFRKPEARSTTTFAPPIGQP